MTPEHQQAEREAFERTFALPVGCTFARISDGSYTYLYVEHAWRGFLAALDWKAGERADVVPSPEMFYASNLAQAIFDQHYSHEPHYASGEIKWELLGDLLGVLTQIDNMVAGIAASQDSGKGGK